jgi:hypothetical protein
MIVFHGGKLFGWWLLIWKIASSHNIILHETIICVLWGVTLPEALPGILRIKFRLRSKLKPRCFPVAARNVLVADSPFET